MRSFSIMRKLQIGITLMIALSLISAFISYKSYTELESTSAEFTMLNKTNNEFNSFIGLITNNTLGYMDAIVDKDSGAVDPTIEKKHLEFKEWLSKGRKSFTEKLHYIHPDTDTEAFFAKANEYSKAGEDMISEIKSKKTDNLDEYDNNIDQINEELQAIVADHLVISEKKFKTASAQVDLVRNVVKHNSLITLLAFVICGTLISVYVNKSIKKTLDNSGKKLKTGASTVLKTSIEFADLGVLIKDSTNKQASSLHESVSAIDEIKATVDRNAELAKESVSIANTCVNSSEKGKSAIKNMLSAVHEIENGQQNTNQMISTTTLEIKEMVEVIKNIGQRTEIINDIVFQTKLLSFNASVEAARAGENGKGFAVVAEEVGNLAAMSGNAAKEISELLNSGISKVESIVEKAEKNSVVINRSNEENIKAGLKTAETCNNALLEIDNNIAKMKTMIEEINISSNEQAQGIGSISVALGELDHITNENVVSASKCASSAEELSAQSKNLENAVETLFIEIHGDNRAS